MRHWRGALTLSVVMAAAAPLLQSCAPIAATGVAMGAAIAADRRTSGTVVEDQRLQVIGTQRLKQALPGTDTAYAYVTAFNRRVLLTGLAPDERSREEAGRIAASLQNVREVHNEIRVHRGSVLPSGLHATGVTARVRGSILADGEVDVNAIKVTTEAGTVYLMGLVTQSEGDRAAQIAARTPGVARVVTLFDYITEQELAALQPRQVEADAPSRQGDR